MTTATTTAGFLPNVRPGTYIEFPSANVRTQLDLSRDLWVTEGFLESATRDGDTVHVTVNAFDPEHGSALGTVEVELGDDQMVQVD